MVGINDISLKYRLTAIMLILGIVPLIILGVLAYNQAAHSLEEAKLKQMESISHLKGEEIKLYFEIIEKQVMTMSDTSSIETAAVEFREAFHAYPDDIRLTDAQLQQKRRDVVSFYNSQFIPLLAPNVDFVPNVDMFVEDTPATIALQERFIANSPYPIGEKHELVSLNDGSQYSEVHEEYHEEIKSFLEEFGFYDVFIVDPETGHIVYSVFKEVDFGTSLLTGPYKDTNFADAFRTARTASEDHSYFLYDFEPYDPSYHSPASFISSPIESGGEIVGVLIFQMPVEKIDNVMTSYGKWETTGLGKTGESLLIGQDLKLRSNPRSLIEDKEAYLHELEEQGYPADEINFIDKLDTAIGIETFDAQYIRNALAGEENLGHYISPTGHEVLASYFLLDVGGVEYAVVTEIDTKEALGPVQTIATFVTVAVIITAIIVTVVALLFSWSIVTPINGLVRQLKDIAQGDGDLTKRAKVNSADEIGQLAKWFNTFVEQVQSIMKKVAASSATTASTAEELSASSEEVNSATTQIANAVQDVARSSQTLSNSSRASQSEVDKLTQSISSVATLAQSSAQKAGDVSDAAKTGSKAATEASQKMNSINQQVSRSAQVVASLGEKTDKIAKIIEVINSVSEQTNLLALNAAIEAARAGEAGRGFAVVADEVRKLAEESQKATKQIESVITDVVNSTKQAVTAMQSGQTEVEEGSQIVNGALASLETIGTQVQEVADGMNKINTSTQEQLAAAQTVNATIVEATKTTEQSAAAAQEVSASVEETSASIKQVAESSQTLANAADDLKNIVSKFRV